MATTMVSMAGANSMGSALRAEKTSPNALAQPLGFFTLTAWSDRHPLPSATRAYGAIKESCA